MGGSSSTQSTQIPNYLTDANKLAISRINQIYEAGRMPFTGIDVVAINPAERAAMDQANMAATAFGMPTAAADPFSGMEMLESGGLRGYSSYPIYLADMKRLKEQRPDQYAALARQSGFDPITGQALAPPAPAYRGGGGGGGYSGGDENHQYTTLREQIRGQDPDRYAFVDDQLNLLHDGNHASMASASVEQGVSGLKSLFSKLKS